MLQWSSLEYFIAQGEKANEHVVQQYNHVFSGDSVMSKAGLIWTELTLQVYYYRGLACIACRLL